MIHTIKKEDNVLVGKQILSDLSHHRTKLEKQMETAPEGYLTGDEFVKRGKETIAKYYTEHGLL